MKRTALTLGILLALATTAGATIHNISIMDNFFSPASRTVTQGDTVRWTNNGSLLHTTTSNTGIWDSGNMSNGMTFQRQFNSVGTFPYQCTIHFGMNGTIIVNAPNVPPNLVLPGPQTVNVPNSFSFPVSATDGNAGDTVNITFQGVNPTPGTTTPAYTGNNPGTFTWTPGCGETGVYYAKFQANDGKGGNDNDSVQLTVQCLGTVVELFSQAFIPAIETVAVGEKVTWAHIDTFCISPCYHTTTSDSGFWDSDSMFQNDSFAYIFDSAGTFGYHCIPHQIDGMVGTIVVCAGIPGDANASGTLTLADVIAAVNFVFNKSGFPACPANGAICWLSGLSCRGNWNGDATVTLADVIRGVNHLFNKPGGPWDPVPVNECCFPAP